ncbi:MAG: hypothetical protein BGO42_13675 [Flavobacterium sp. 40-81]|nr:MAG: hypothetical protein ABS44_13775 [Chryseobacterium sp. SCN 40-13]OJV69412.1 MAG: hypothetical protein BGO42_13675 [Flavobacterium sp. 40-81]
MKDSALKIGVVSCFVLNTFTIMGAPVPPPPAQGAPPPPGAPIDGSVYFLLGIGLIYAFYYFKNIAIKKASR